MGRPRGGNEEHAFEVERPPHFRRNDQVANVDRVECPAENPNVCHSLWLLHSWRARSLTKASEAPWYSRANLAALRWRPSLFDYHVHSEFSVDCKIPVAEMCRAAAAAGVTELAITDHVDHEPADPGAGYYQAEAYFDAIERARDEFGDHLVVLAGAEVDFNRRIAIQVERFLLQHDYDFVIGSVHYGEGGEIIFQEFFENRALDDVFLPYFDEIEAAVETGWFDTLGHLDLPKRYLPRTRRTYDPLAYKERLQPIFGKLIAQGMSFEINTSGIRQAPKTSMPGPAVVRWYVEAGGQLITTGTDSHAPQTVGAGLAMTVDMLELCGIDAISSFRKRQRTQTPISRLRQSRAVPIV